MSESRFGWVEEYETFGWIVVEGMSEAEAVARLGAGAAVALAAGDAWEWDGPTFGVRAVGDRLLLWDDADLGLDVRVPLWLGVGTVRVRGLGDELVLADRRRAGSAGPAVRPDDAGPGRGRRRAVRGRGGRRGGP